MATLICQIKELIEQKLDVGFRRFIIFPFGDVGMQVREVLRNAYGIDAEYVLDNRLCRYNPEIKELEFLDKVSCDDFCVILASTNTDIYVECKKELQRYFADDNIAEFSSMVNWGKGNMRGGGGYASEKNALLKSVNIAMGHYVKTARL